MIVALVGLVLTLGWQAWMIVRPRPLALDTQRRVVAEEAAARLAEQMPEPEADHPTLVVGRFVNDPSGEVTEAVRVAVDRLDRYAVRPATVVENVQRELGLEPTPLDPGGIDPSSLDKLESDYLLAGRVGSLRTTGEADEAILEAVLLSKRDPTQPIRLRAEAGRGRQSGPPGETVRSYPWPARLLSWIALVALLPLVIAPLAFRGLERESNLVNVSMLVGLTAVAALAALAMLGFRVDTAWSAAGMIGAVAVACVYNWAVLARMEDVRV
jgi:hypothetical protein